MKASSVKNVAITTLLLLVPAAGAQRGAGEATGIAQRAVKPELTTMSGKVMELKEEPCDGTTGKSKIGVHLIVKTKDEKTLNVHLGPLHAVDHVVDQISVGEELSFDAFRTDALPANEYIAKSIRLEDKVINLRDDDLRPSWEYGSGKGRGKGKGKGRKGHGRGFGPCW